MYRDGDKVRLKNGAILTIRRILKSVDMTEAYETYENILVTLDMIQEKIN